MSHLQKKTILKPYLTHNGMFDYEKMQDDNWIEEMVGTLENANTEEMSREEELAFWLNAYNLLTIKSVCQKLEKNPNWEGVTSLFRRIKFFYLKRHLVAGQKISLYSLENKILRVKFGDPRIHFALNCASKSCPYLPGKLFYAEDLDDYLNQLTSDFINNQSGVEFTGEDKLQISRIFKWYEDDFEQAGGVVPFIKQYWKGREIPHDPSITYHDYDWSVNKFSQSSPR